MTQRILILGGPRTGKTTLAKSLAIENVRHTDDLIEKYQHLGRDGWSAAAPDQPARNPAYVARHAKVQAIPTIAPCNECDQPVCLADLDIHVCRPEDRAARKARS